MLGKGYLNIDEIVEPVKPEAIKYGLTDDQYAKLQIKYDKILNDPFLIKYLSIVIIIISSAIFILIAMEDKGLGVFIICIITCVTFALFEYLEDKYKDIRINLLQDIDKYKAYKNDLLSYSLNKREYDKQQGIISYYKEKERLNKEKEIKRRQYQYWISMNPYEFEKEVSVLYENQGYKAKVTKGSGDGGIDILLEKNGLIGIVQCKRFKNKVGPGPIRDLYGTMKSGKYNFAIAICPSGFSDNAYNFSKGKNIRLVGLKQIMEMINA